MRNFNKIEKVKKTYLGDAEFIELEGDGYIKMTVPIDPGNRDYRKLMEMQRKGEIQIPERTVDLPSRS